MQASSITGRNALRKKMKEDAIEGTKQECKEKCNIITHRVHSRRQVAQGKKQQKTFEMFGTGPLLGHALENAWDRLALGTAARSWDMPCPAQPFSLYLRGHMQVHASQVSRYIAMRHQKFQ